MRFVLRGDLLEKGVHYLEGASSMCAVESTRMLVSFAAAEDMALHTIDFTQAFTNAPQPNPHLYCELPDLPDELKGKICGGGKHKLKVGHLKRNLYGDVQAGRVWEQYIRHWIIKNVEGARFYINDRNAFEWSFEGETLRGVVHVDDVLFAVSGSKIRAAFVSKLAAAFKVTGGVEEATEFCGLQIDRDWANHTVRLHQRSFAEALVKKYEPGTGRAAAMPYLTTKEQLIPQDTEAASESEKFEYMCMIGDLTWYSRTNPGIAWRAADLARHMQNPAPVHIEAAKYVMRYIADNLDAGLTYHGSKSVLTQSYDHTNTLVAVVDAGFRHEGDFNTSGAAILMNGAAIAWKTRRQTTISLTTAEAEVKACSVVVEMIRSLTDLHGEFTHSQHATVRTMIDSVGAESQITRGLDNKACASYKRAQHYCEDARDTAVMWLDRVPGELNAADLLTKRVKCEKDFRFANGVLSGAQPELYESAAVLKILSKP